MKMIKEKLHLKNCFFIALGSAILSFGLYNVHSFSKVTEGGILGLVLLLEHWLNISPALSGLVLNAICYLIGFKLLGKGFAFYSIIAGGSFSLFYALFESFPPIFPKIADFPLLAAVLGAVFVGIGVGISIRFGGAPSGDDALALGISTVWKVKIEWVYFISDILVLILSLTYIPFRRIAFSLLTVIISSKLVGFVQRFEFGKKYKNKDTKIK